MAVGLIIAVGIILLTLLGLLLWYLDRRQKRKMELQERREETRQEEAKAREKLFEEETVDPIERELKDE